MRKSFIRVLFFLGVPGLAVSLAGANARLLRQPTISRSAVVFVYAGDLWSVPRAGGEATRLTQTPGVEGSPRFSPDGRQIAFTRSGDVYVIPAEGGAERRLTWHPASDVAVGWTPDGARILIQSGRQRGSVTAHPTLFLLPASGGWPEALPIPRATFGSFAGDGRRLAYSPTPEMVLYTPWKRYRGGALGRVALYDLERHSYEELPRVQANDVFPMWAGEAIYFVSDRDRTMNLYRYDLARKTTTRLTQYSEWDIKNPCLGPDAIVYENGGWLYRFDLREQRAAEIPVALPDGALPKEDARARWQQALEEAWNVYRTRAFSPAPNWDSIKPRYVELMQWAADASDAESVLREMLGEAGQSHVSLQRRQAATAAPAGLLGADFRVENGRYRIARIYPGDAADEKRRGPLAGTAVREGDFLLAVNGVPVPADRELPAAFEGLAGKEAVLTVGGEAAGDTRQVTVRPVADERALRYSAWLQESAERVRERSQGRVGYLHVPNVDAAGVEGFRRDWRTLRGKVAAVIIDIRNNTGGTQPQDVWDWIARKPVKVMYDRNGRVPAFGGPYLDGPKVMIANDQSVSGGDELAYYFQREKLGTLVGTRTMGGMIGQGGEFRVGGEWVMGIPQLGFYWFSPDGWAPENRGVEPDVVSELLPWSRTGGRDAQLEKAIDAALEALRDFHPAIPAAPPYRPEP